MPHYVAAVLEESEPMTNSMRSGSRLLAFLLGVAIACGVAAGCGGRQQPPTTGTCHPWREWVPPQRDENGQWRDGYCRDRPGGRS